MAGHIYIGGDTHGNSNDLRTLFMQIENPTKDDVLIITGDAGFEYGHYVMGAAKKTALKFPGTIIVIRGNHDNRYWADHTIDGKPASNSWNFVEDENGNRYLRQKKYPNIWYVPDEGCIYNIKGYNFMFIPGAYSVDKWYRLQNGYPYCDDEQLTDEERENLYKQAQETQVDFVIAHTFPQKIVEGHLRYLFLRGLDQSMVDRSQEIWLDKMAEIFENQPTFKHYFGGHYHDSKELTDKYTILYHTVIDIEDYI